MSSEASVLPAVTTPATDPKKMKRIVLAALAESPTNRGLDFGNLNEDEARTLKQGGPEAVTNMLLTKAAEHVTERLMDAGYGLLDAPPHN